MLDTVQNRNRIPHMKTDPANLLRENGLQVTAQRVAVMKAVSSKPHSTADQVITEVRSTIGTVSRQAVYDALSTLSDKGLIRRIQPAGSSALYEDRVGDNHHHVICRSCGKAADVDCATGHTPCLTASNDAGFTMLMQIHWQLPTNRNQQERISIRNSKSFRRDECYLTTIKL